jgi:hypothetical protein
VASKCDFFVFFKLLILRELRNRALHVFDNRGISYYPCENKQVTRTNAKSAREDGKDANISNIKERGAPVGAPSVFRIANWWG